MKSTRTFARVDTVLPLRLRVIDATEAELLARRYAVERTLVEIAPPEHSAPAPEDRSWEQDALIRIMQRLDALEGRLARVEEAVGARSNDDEGWIQGETDSCSGSGLGALVPSHLPQGTLVEGELTMHGATIGKVRFLGRIANVKHPDGERFPVGRYHVGVAFVGIHPEDREAIV
ncbi:MAG: PilZ domain-containing protein, partial [Acidobacteria bacterium]